MAITTNLKKADGVDLGNNLFAGNGTSSGNQTFNLIQANGIDIGKGWYNKSYCRQAYGNIGFKNAAGTDIGTLLGKYGTLNCTCDTDVDACDTDSDSDTDTDTCDVDVDACFVHGALLTKRGDVFVEDIVEGDEIWGADEQWHVVLGVSSATVGSRKIFKLPGGGAVTSDHVVFFDGVAKVGDASAFKATGKGRFTAANGVVGMYDAPDVVVEADAMSVCELEAETKTFSPICETSFVGYLNGFPVLIAGKA